MDCSEDTSKYSKLHAEIVNCKNKAKDPTSVDVKVSELQSKVGILEAENKLLLEVNN